MTRRLAARRPPSYWAVLAGVLLACLLAARIGLWQLRSVEESPPHQEEIALRARLAAGDVETAVTRLEVARQHYLLGRSTAQFETLGHEHEHLHATIGVLRSAIAEMPGMLAEVDSAERAVGVWTDEIVPAEALGSRGRAGAGRDAPLFATVRRHLAAVFATAVRVHDDAQRDVRGRHRHVEWLWLGATAFLVLMLAVFHELAYRRSQRVAEAARQMDLLLGALPFALLGIDRGLRIRQATGFIHQVMGVTTRALRGMLVTDLVGESDRVTLEAAARTALRGAAKTCEVVTRGDGHRARALAVQCSPIREQGEIVGVSAVIHDITTERALQAQVLQSDRLATVGALVASVVHEINNPLSAILAYAALVDKSSLTTEDQAALDTIASECRRAAQIARNLLDFSRRRARPHEPTDLARVVERAVALRRHDLTSHGAQLLLDLAPVLADVEGDAQQLQQVLLNLLINAEHAVRDCPQPHILIRLEPVAGMVRLSVEDNGPGVPDDRREAVFEPFFTTKPEGEGTGLGLSVSRGIVAAHQGRMWVERASGGGARFVVELPTSPAGKTHAGPAAAPAPALGGERPSRAVLVVDDEPANRDSLGRLLRRLGYRVRVAAGALDALAMIEQELPDAIVSDVHMAQLDGAEFYGLLAERWPALAERTAFMSGADAGDPVCRDLVKHQCVILRKPFEPSELRAVVETLLTTSRRDS